MLALELLHRLSTRNAVAVRARCNARGRRRRRGLSLSLNRLGARRRGGVLRLRLRRRHRLRGRLEARDLLLHVLNLEALRLGARCGGDARVDLHRRLLRCERSRASPKRLSLQPDVRRARRINLAVREDRAVQPLVRRRSFNVSVVVRVAVERARGEVRGLPVGRCAVDSRHRPGKDLGALRLRRRRARLRRVAHGSTVNRVDRRVGVHGIEAAVGVEAATERLRPRILRAADRAA